MITQFSVHYIMLQTVEGDELTLVPEHADFFFF